VRSLPAAPAAPTTYVVPKVTGDPAAARQLAEACRGLAEAIQSAQRSAAHIVADLSATWRGIGQRAIHAPLESLQHSAGTAARQLHEIADELDTYAARLEKAHHHHGFSLHKLLVIGAVVTVSLVAITVTIGAAGVVEAAAASAAVSGAIDAAGAASAADLAAADGIESAFDAMAWLRPLASFVVPNLLQFEWAAGGTAVWQEVTIGRLKWGRIAETGGIAFVAGAAAGKATSAIEDSEWLSGAPARLRSAAPHLVEGTAWSGAEAADEAMDHRFSPLDISEAFVLAGGSTLARDELRERELWPAERDYRREALIGLVHRQGIIVDPAIAHEMALVRQSARELRSGEIDLRLNEGPGHTIGRHVSKSADELLMRVRNSRLRIASTYWDETTAQDVVKQTLSAHADVIRRWTKAGGPDTLRLRLQAPYHVGFGVNRRGRVEFIRQAVVVLRRDRSGLLLVTSYPLGRGR